MMLRAFTTTCALAIVSLFVYAGWGFYIVTLEEAGEASQAGQLFTPARGAMIMVIGYATVGFHFFVQVLLDIGWIISRKTPPPEWIAEASHGEAAPAPTEDKP